MNKNEKDKINLYIEYMQCKDFDRAIEVANKMFIENDDLLGKLCLLTAKTCNILKFFNIESEYWRDYLGETLYEAKELSKLKGLNKFAKVNIWWVYRSLSYSKSTYYPDYADISTQQQREILGGMIYELFHLKDDIFLDVLQKLLETYGDVLTVEKQKIIIN